MCGITGAVWTSPERALDDTALERMTEALRHRGPDDAGAYRCELRRRPPAGDLPGVALGFRRLAILDVAGGAQPLTNEDETVWVVFNGEIYNYRELRRRLEGAGHRFRTQSDTEVLVHLYEDEGPELCARLNGMFAFALWDARRGRLVLGRDRLGKKPLVYRCEPERLLFASELKSLLAAPDVPRELDPSALDEYLAYQYVPHPNTIYRGIRKLPPGCHAVWEAGRLTVTPYWRPSFAEQPLREEEAVEELRALLRSAVELRLQSEVPLGAFLSGGIDSSLIVALMQELSPTPVRAFTIGFERREYDESPHAREVARWLGVEHHVSVVSSGAADLLPKLVRQYDEPFADSSAAPTWRLCEETRKHVTVALSGDGGDELFAGYDRYRAVELAGRLDRAAPLKTALAWGARLAGGLAGGSPRSFFRRAARFGSWLPQPAVRRYFEWVSVFGEAARAELYTDDALARLPNSDPCAFLAAAWKQAAGRDAVTVASLADLTTYLPCDLMTKVDLASMAHGLEVRCPFLDYRVVEFAASLPLRLKRRRGRGKRLLARAFGQRLPRTVFRRRKRGFGAPVAEWLRGELQPLLRETLLAPDARSAAWLRPDVAARLAAEHQREVRDHSHRLWALLFLELWLREWEPGMG